MAEWVTDVEQYWLKRGKRYFTEPSKWGVFRTMYTQKVVKTLMTMLKTLHFETVFEVGCGYGRITKAILQQFPNVTIRAIDLSPDQIKIARRYINNDRVELIVGKIQDLDVKDRNFDLVIAVSVLMHIPFHDIDGVVSRMTRMSKRHIVNVDWYGSGTQVVFRGYCFAHDYASLYKKFGFRQVQMVPIPKRPVYGISFGLDSGFRVFRREEEVQCLWLATKS